MTPPDRETSRELADALDGRREAALHFWQSIANGHPLDDETVVFLRHVAAAIMEADRTPGRERYAALTAACGLAGDRSPWPELEDYVRRWLLAHELRTGSAPPVRADLIRDAIAAGLVPGEADDAAGRRRVGAMIDRVLQRSA